MPDVALLSASIPLLTPVLRNNWKVPEPACNCLGSLSNFRCAAATDPRKACYLLNYQERRCYQLHAGAVGGGSLKAIERTLTGAEKAAEHSRSAAPRRP